MRDLIMSFVTSYKRSRADYMVHAVALSQWQTVVKITGRPQKRTIFISL